MKVSQVLAFGIITMPWVQWR